MENEIKQVLFEVFESQNPDTELPVIQNETVLLETGLDSLGFAILVTKLEMMLGFDPFSLSDEAYYPQTFGDFVNFYEKNKPT